MSPFGEFREQVFAFLRSRQLRLTHVTGDRAILRRPAAIRRFEAEVDTDGFQRLAHPSSPDEEQFAESWTFRIHTRGPSIAAQDRCVFPTVLRIPSMWRTAAADRRDHDNAGELQTRPACRAQCFRRGHLQTRFF